ncbi:hypothetical protein ATPR_0555 [Acetobacter tropicalis NBRC 101654]|uniref:Uncharacterized protein n=1 Tax=Acetobacter tropicalis NBRC 101654 TaxID=749388 RepID=F7VB06_9PROT|nr:hypothetical protein ATPR_0555 [Acetobacter tropicalis NBRC 101654]
MLKAGNQKARNRQKRGTKEKTPEADMLRRFLKNPSCF